MSKDLLRSLLVAIGGIATARWGVPEDLVFETSNYIVTTIFGGIALWGMWQSFSKPADDDPPRPKK